MNVGIIKSIKGKQVQIAKNRDIFRRMDIKPITHYLNSGFKQKIKIGDWILFDIDKETPLFDVLSASLLLKNFESVLNIQDLIYDPLLPDDFKKIIEDKKRYFLNSWEITNLDDYISKIKIAIEEGRKFYEGSQYFRYSDFGHDEYHGLFSEYSFTNYLDWTPRGYIDKYLHKIIPVREVYFLTKRVRTEAADHLLYNSDSTFFDSNGWEINDYTTKFNGHSFEWGNKTLPLIEYWTSKDTPYNEESHKKSLFEEVNEYLSKTWYKLEVKKIALWFPAHKRRCGFMLQINYVTK